MIQTLGKFEKVFTVEFSSTYIYVDTKDMWCFFLTASVATLSDCTEAGKESK